jgi:uncharacterized protein
MFTRRRFLRLLGQGAMAATAAGVYGFIVEPGLFLRTQHYAFTPPRWTPGLNLRLVILSDPHLADPQMPLDRWRKIIEQANRLDGDVMLLLGDYSGSHFLRTADIPVSQTAKVAAGLRAPLGVYSIMGNHDWWDDLAAQKRGEGPILGQRAFEDAGIPVLENRALPLAKDGLRFWLAGTGSIVAIKKGRRRYEGRDDLDGTLAQVTDNSPIVHLAHEPDLFTIVPERISITLSGHTHGGQIRLFGYSPVTPSQFGNRLAYGHIVEDGRHLVVSGGLGCSILPVRFGMPPEITVVDLGVAPA